MIVIQFPWLFNFILKRFAGIALLMFAIVKDRANTRLINHEHIHIHQQIETLFAGFYVIYGVDFLIKLFVLRDWYKAYKCVCFEKEAYENDTNLTYHVSRVNWNWIKHFGKI